MTLSHLRALEAESIHIIREVAAEFERPVMLYSIGKDSSVMVRLAQKAVPGREWAAGTGDRTASGHSLPRTGPTREGRGRIDHYRAVESLKR